MADEVLVTVVVLLQNGPGGIYETREFKKVSVNTRAPARDILRAILAGLAKKGLNLNDADMLIQASDGSPLSNMSINNGSRILIMPKNTSDLVNFGE